MLKRVPYFLAAPKDGRDMTKKIQAKLDIYGICILGAGDFVTTGIGLPYRGTLMGMGASSRLILADEVRDGAAVRLSCYSAVKNLSIIGSEETAGPQALGERHGILFEGTATDYTDYDHTNQPYKNTVSGCIILGFSGGGITCRHTGYSVASSIAASDCHIRYSGAGILISHFSEFHNFTNVACSQNLYGCINNGGNNNFVNCCFSANGTGFVIDNTDGQAPNCAHGSAVGCTFHHSDHNEGVGIYIKDATPGFVFSGGNLGFSKIVLENADAIVFNGFNFLRHVAISISGGTLTLFSGCAFHATPTLSVENNDAVHFDSCYMQDGTPYKPI